MTRALPRLRRGSAALVALTAGAAILAPGALGDNALLSTANPTLVAVDAIAPSTVIACFDQGLSSSVSGLDSGFYLEGFTVGRKITGTAQLDSSDSACADITFASGVDAKSYTLAVDTAGSVSSTSGAASNDSAVPVSTNPPVFPLHSGIVARPQRAATGILPAAGTYAFRGCRSDWPGSCLA
ncbi:MAG TPA: hypothetical protein VHX88_02795 [Solirubrobacteraceae bacterium]|jgi:hypothetical protein|nr:hypothetical protein [Solirubrobacteraceae bacterium]